MALKAPICGGGDCCGGGGGAAVWMSSSSTPRATVRAASFPLLKTQFVPGAGVGGLKVVHMPSLRSDKGSCAALGSQMNLFNGLARAAKSAFGSIREMDAIQVTDGSQETCPATKGVLASEEKLEDRYKLAIQASDKWSHISQLALEQGNKHLSKEALEKSKSEMNCACSTKAQLDQLSNTKVMKKPKPVSLREKFAKYHNHPHLSRKTQAILDETLEALYAYEKELKFMQWLIDL